jgi:chromosome segregation ATPase
MFKIKFKKCFRSSWTSETTTLNLWKDSFKTVFIFFFTQGHELFMTLAQSLKANRTPGHENVPSDVYKRLLDQIDQNNELSQANSHLLQENSQLKQALSQLSTKLQDALDSKTEKDHVIEILRDELHAHQLELVQKEAKLSEFSTQIQQLQSENQMLVDKLMNQKLREASELNEANAIITS